VAPGTGTPTGTVRFFDGGVQIGSAFLSNGSAALSTAGLAVGSHTITAGYDGSVSYKASTSAALTQAIR
jgi:zinc transporter ZupT